MTAKQSNGQIGQALDRTKRKDPAETRKKRTQKRISPNQNLALRPVVVSTRCQTAKLRH